MTRNDRKQDSSFQSIVVKGTISKPEQRQRRRQRGKGTTHHFLHHKHLLDPQHILYTYISVLQPDNAVSHTRRRFRDNQSSSCRSVDCQIARQILVGIWGATGSRFDPSAYPGTLRFIDPNCFITTCAYRGVGGGLDFQTYGKKKRLPQGSFSEVHNGVGERERFPFSLGVSKVINLTKRNPIHHTIAKTHHCPRAHR